MLINGANPRALGDVARACVQFIIPTAQSARSSPTANFHVVIIQTARSGLHTHTARACVRACVRVGGGGSLMCVENIY